MGLVSVTFRKLWPVAAGPGGLAPARSGPDPDPGPGPGPGRARPLPPSSGLEAGLSGRGELPPSQARARGSAAAAILAQGGPTPGGGREPGPRYGSEGPPPPRRPRCPRLASDCARRHRAGASLRGGARRLGAGPGWGGGPAGAGLGAGAGAGPAGRGGCGSRGQVGRLAGPGSAPGWSGGAGRPGGQGVGLGSACARSRERVPRTQPPTTCGARTRACAGVHPPRGTGVPPAVRRSAGRPGEHAALLRDPRVGSGAKACRPCVSPPAVRGRPRPLSSHAWALPHPEYPQAPAGSSAQMGTS